MYIASQLGHCGVVRMLLEAKADVHIKTNVSHAAWWCLCTDSMVDCMCVLSPLCISKERIKEILELLLVKVFLIHENSEKLSSSKISRYIYGIIICML